MLEPFNEDPSLSAATGVSKNNISQKTSSPSLMLEPFNEGPSLSAATGESKNNISQKTPSEKKAIEKSAYIQRGLMSQRGHRSI